MQSDVADTDRPLHVQLNDLAVDLGTLKSAAKSLAVDLSQLEDVPADQQAAAGMLHVALKAAEAEAWETYSQARDADG
jgi:hypothetical protein